MKIFGNYDALRPDRAAIPASPVGPTNAQGQAAATPVEPVRKTDSVELSDSGRSLAKRLNVEQRAELDPERTAELRRKVLEGAYNTLDVVDQVARRILQRGDL